MAAISITPANVRNDQSGGTGSAGIAGATITAGQVLNLNSSGQLIPAVNDTVAHAICVGIALNNASANQPVNFHNNGQIDVGGTVAIGKVYVLGTAGGIIPVDDNAGGEIISVIGVGIATNRFLWIPNGMSGVAAAGAVT